MRLFIEILMELFWDALLYQLGIKTYFFVAYEFIYYKSWHLLWLECDLMAIYSYLKSNILSPPWYSILNGLIAQS